MWGQAGLVPHGCPKLSGPAGDVGHRDYMQWWCGDSVALQVAFVKGPIQPRHLWVSSLGLLGCQHPCLGQSSSARALARTELTALLMLELLRVEAQVSLSSFIHSFPLVCVNLLLVLRTEPLENLFFTLSFITVTEYDQSILLKLYSAL